MSTIDQCPSTKGTTEIPETPADLARLSGRKVWRSADEFSGDPGFRDFVEREFPGGASLLDETSRRSFMKVMGASVALAGAATLPGCRRPDRHILPYSAVVPEDVIPGRPLYYATALPLPGGGAEGILVETHTGRPTKVEGNPLHPNNRGATSAFAQASILGLYDPDRLKFPMFENPSRGKLAGTWDDFKAWQGDHFAKFDATGGSGLAFVVDKQSSPTMSRMKSLVEARWPNASWVNWNPAEQRGMIDGTTIAFGAPHRARYRFENTERVVSIGSDFTADGADQVYQSRGFAKTRRVHNANESMSRLYVAESRPTATGSMADHRFRVAPSQMPALVNAIAREMGIGAPSGDPEGISSEHIKAMVEDLMSHRGAAVVVPGESLPAESYALCMAINGVLGAMGSIVELYPVDADVASNSASAMATLTNELNAGAIDTVVVLNANPVYDAPGVLGFADAFAKAPMRITLSVGTSETASASTWSLNGAHSFEAWGDTAASDGSLSVVQPLIAPLFSPSYSAIELLSLLLGDDHGGSGSPDGYELVTDTWAGKSRVGVGSEAFKKTWRRALHDGVLAGSEARPVNARIRMMDVTRAAAAMQTTASGGGNALEVAFYTERFNDGRSANNAWLMELPELGTSVVWDNPVLLSPRTAKELGLLPEHSRIDEFNPYTKQQMPQARVATLTIDGQQVDVPVWIQPGMADYVVGVKLGYGRTDAGLVGNKAGFNTYAVKGASMSGSGAKLERTGSTYTIASTQNHWSIGADSATPRGKKSRDTLVRAVDKKYWDLHGDSHLTAPDEIYGSPSSHLNAAEQLGELSHTPPNISAYENPLNRSDGNPDPDNVHENEVLNRDTPPAYTQGPQWGMSIDMNACSGCGVCTVACQSENNIAVVGKSEVAKGREMTWIRVDRYFVGEDLNNPDEMIPQPVACVHCENAPCETVCPVNATIHGPEGTNNMAYNRCIGTRYCANNCPYKVRRFNFFDYGVAKFNGGLDATYVTGDGAELFEETVGQDRTFNQNLIPPRLREKLDEISKMKFNPDVTVRSRGVMEKCSYCIQRVNQARQDVKIQGIWNEADQVAPIPDGFFQSACQQACPTGAISFGDILDPNSAVTKDRDSGRTYMMLGYLNTRPRTTYMMRVRNPNSAIRVYDQKDPWDHGDGHGHDHGGHGDDHSDSHSDGGHASAAFIDTVKQYTDQGYSLSLRVLSGSPA